MSEPAAAVADAESRSPELELARLGVARAGKLVALARRERFPDFTVSAGIMPRGSQLDPMWQAGLAFNLPVLAGRKQNRAISENEARAEADRQGAETVAQILRLRVNERLVALQRLNDTLRLYREGLLVQSLATAESTLAQYRVGRVTFARPRTRSWAATTRRTATPSASSSTGSTSRRAGSCSAIRRPPSPRACSSSSRRSPCT